MAEQRPRDDIDGQRDAATQTHPPDRDDAVSSETATARDAGRGGLALTAAKLYFLVLGFAQQIVLGQVLGADGYGALRGALSPASITYNPLISAGVQGMSRAVSRTPASERAATVRRGLLVHLGLAIVVALGFWVSSPVLGGLLGSQFLVPAFRILSVVVLFYGLYAPFVGVLNGARRFAAQAGLDVVSATLRTAALIVGALWLLPRGQLLAVEGACWGFAAVSVAMVLVSLMLVGWGRTGSTRLSAGEHLGFILPVIGSQLVLNLLLQADMNTLRAFGSRAAERAGLAPAAANELVGAYNAGQLFGFLPYQMLIGITFILFPLLATAHARGDAQKVKSYVLEGNRIALILTGLIVAISASISGSLLQLAFNERFAELGTDSMQVLTLGLGAFALFGVFTTVLNSLGRQWVSLSLTAAATGLVVALNWLWVSRVAFGPELLIRTAQATSIGMVAAAIVGAVLVQRFSGGVVPWLSMGRILAATAVVIVLGRQLPLLGRAFCVAASMALAVVYVLLLVVSRELGPRDGRRVLALLGRR